MTTSSTSSPRPGRASARAPRPRPTSATASSASRRCASAASRSASAPTRTCGSTRSRSCASSRGSPAGAPVAAACSRRRSCSRSAPPRARGRLQLEAWPRTSVDLGHRSLAGVAARAPRGGPHCRLRRRRPRAGGPMSAIEVDRGDLRGRRRRAVVSRRRSLVDFWAEWCGPCHALAPVLDAAVEARDGAVTLAKVDVDANPALSQQFSVSGIPAVKAFRDGRVVAEFAGARPRVMVDAFLDELLAPPRLDRPARGAPRVRRAARASSPRSTAATSRRRCASSSTPFPRRMPAARAAARGGGRDLRAPRPRGSPRRHLPAPARRRALLSLASARRARGSGPSTSPCGRGRRAAPHVP